MYLSKKQIKALEIAMEALDFGLTNNVQTEDSAYAADTICDMLIKDREQKRKRKMKNES